MTLVKKTLTASSSLFPSATRLPRAAPASNTTLKPSSKPSRLAVANRLSN